MPICDNDNVVHCTLYSSTKDFKIPGYLFAEIKNLVTFYQDKLPILTYI